MILRRVQMPESGVIENCRLTILSAPIVFAATINMRLTTRSRLTPPGTGMNRTYSDVAFAWIAATGRRPGPTSTFSGWRRTVEMLEHATSASANAGSQRMARTLSLGVRILGIVRRIAIATLCAVALGGSAAAQTPAPAPAPPPGSGAEGPGPEQALTQRIAVWRLEALGLEIELVARLETLFRSELDRLAKTPLPSRREMDRAVGKDRKLR